jgi:hypothetical protein
VEYCRKDLNPASVHKREVFFLVLEDSHGLWECWYVTAYAGSDLSLKGLSPEFHGGGNLLKLARWSQIF